MKIEEIIKRMNNLLSNEHNKLCDDWACIASYIIELEADKLEAYKKIVHLDNGLKAMTNIVCCERYRCSLPDNKQHDEDCLVHKASKYLGERSERD